MATETPTPEPVEPNSLVAAETPPAPEPTAEQVQQPVPAPEQPKHDPWLVHQAKELSVSEAEINQMSPGELQRSVVLLARQQARIAQELAKPKPSEPAPTPPEPEWDLPPELKTQIEEMNPAILAAIKLANKASDEKVKALQAKLAQTTQQVQGQAFADQIHAEMVKIPVGQREAVYAKVVALEQSGELKPGTPPHVAIPMAHKLLKAAFGITESPAPAPGTPAPTPSARPANRLRAPDEGLSAREALKRIYQEKLDAWDAEEETNSQANGSFRP